MTDTQRPWDRLTTESDPAYEAFTAYLDTGSLRDAYRQRSGKVQATSAPGAWTGWSTKYNWVSRRAAYVEFTVRECQDATQVGLVQIRKWLTTRRLWCGESHAHGPHARLRPRQRAQPLTRTAGGRLARVSAPTQAQVRVTVEPATAAALEAEVTQRTRC